MLLANANAINILDKTVITPHEYKMLFLEKKFVKQKMISE